MNKLTCIKIGWVVELSGQNVGVASDEIIRWVGFNDDCLKVYPLREEADDFIIENNLIDIAFSAEHAWYEVKEG